MGLWWDKASTNWCRIFQPSTPLLRWSRGQGFEMFSPVGMDQNCVPKLDGLVNITKARSPETWIYPNKPQSMPRPPCLTNRCARKTSPLGWSCCPAAWRLSLGPHWIHIGSTFTTRIQVSAGLTPGETRILQIQLRWTCWKMLNNTMSTSFLMTAMVHMGRQCCHLDCGRSNPCPATRFGNRIEASIKHSLHLPWIRATFNSFSIGKIQTRTIMWFFQNFCWYSQLLPATIFPINSYGVMVWISIILYLFLKFFFFNSHFWWKVSQVATEGWQLCWARWCYKWLNRPWRPWPWRYKGGLDG